jgi:uncharacterized protein
LSPLRTRWYNSFFAMKRHCPICKRPTDSDRDADFPFCSERCRLLDLGAWAAEKYVVSEPIFSEDDDEFSDPTDKSNDTTH